jgi:hypothetical protein
MNSTTRLILDQETPLDACCGCGSVHSIVDLYLCLETLRYFCDPCWRKDQEILRERREVA